MNEPDRGSEGVDEWCGEKEILLAIWRELREVRKAQHLQRPHAPPGFRCPECVELGL